MKHMARSLVSWPHNMSLLSSRTSSQKRCIKICCLSLTISAVDWKDDMYVGSWVVGGGFHRKEGLGRRTRNKRLGCTEYRTTDIGQEGMIVTDHETCKLHTE